MENQRSQHITLALSQLAKAVCYLILFLGCQMVVTTALIVPAAIRSLSHGVLDPALILLELAEMATPLTLLSNLLTLLFLIVFFLLRRKHPLREVGLRPIPPLAAAGSLSLAPVLYAAVIGVMSLLPTAWLSSYAQAASWVDGGDVVSFLAVGIAAPVTEEVVFRGLIQSRLARAMPGWAAVLLASAMFAVLHGHPVWMGYAFVMGLVLGLMALRSGSILPGLLTHMVFNLIGQILSLPALAQVDGWLVLAVLLLAGGAACLFTRKGVRALFQPNPSRKEGESDV